MPDEPDKPRAMDDPVIPRLVKVTGITPEQARELVAMLGGSNWSSLLREARLLRKQ